MALVFCKKGGSQLKRIPNSSDIKAKSPTSKVFEYLVGSLSLLLLYKFFFVVVKDSFPLPHTDELINDLVSAALFSKLDLDFSNNEVERHSDSRDLTAFIPPKCIFRFKRVRFGLASLPATFRHFSKVCLKFRKAAKELFC